MSLRPPPIQEPWRMDNMGRLTSPAWVLWLRELANSDDVSSAFSDTLSLQSTESVSTIQPESASSESATQLEMLQPQSSTSRVEDDALLFCWMSF